MDIKNIVVAIDDFFETPLYIASGLGEPHSVEFAGDMYHNIIASNNEVDSKFSSRVYYDTGLTIVPKLAFFRYEPPNSEPTHWIHADNSVAEYTGIVYLSDRHDGGTALWNHKIAGRRNNKPEYHQWLGADENDESRWQLTDLIGTSYNRCVLFSGDRFHSKFPRLNLEQRLTYVCFFDIPNS